MKRRTFLRGAAGTAAGTALLPVWRRAFCEAEPDLVVTLDFDDARPAVFVPANFVGLGYEMSSAARLGLLSIENTPYVNLVRNLGHTGVLRFGGIVADFTSYEPDGTVATEPKHTVVTRASLVQLRAFLDKTGWGAMWSVNFGQGTLPQAIEEARDVAAVLGDRLLFLELGNEVENYGRGTHPLRQPPYTFAAYRNEYTKWHGALVAAVPEIRFAAPDTAASVEWVEQMAAEAGDTVQLLTTHYYRGGQAEGTPEQLASSDPALETNLARLRRASQRAGVPWRMCETNSFFGGGRPGVSNTLLGALWTLDYMLLLALSGCGGVNLETGVNQLGFISSYSPIQDDTNGHNAAGAPYYGMLAFAQAFQHGSEMIPMQMQPVLPGLTAYTLRAGGKRTALVLINRNATTSPQVVFEVLEMKHASALRLQGAAALSAEGLALGGAQVSPSGQWRPARLEPVHGKSIHVPSMSAVVVLE